MSTPNMYPGGRRTPAALAVARQLGVDLRTARATGPGGAITVADAYRAAGRSEDAARWEARRQPGRSRSAAAHRPMPRSAVASAPTRPHLIVSQRSLWTRENTMVDVDAYGPNPVAEDLRQVAPNQYTAAIQRSGAPPTLFATGDLPLFTTSGMDPQLLMQLPYVARHAAAAASAPEASELFETYGAPSRETWDAALMTFCLEPANLAYENRLLAWGATDA